MPAQVDISGDGAAANLSQTPATGGILRPATGTVTRVNFQPESSLIPVGFLADKGRLFAVRSNGLTYGWTVAKTGRQQVRYYGIAPELDTCARLIPTAGDQPGIWEIALPNGTYPVVIIAGDPLSTTQTNHLSVEGTTLTDPDPLSPAGGYTQGDFDGWATTVTVTDGALTITSAGSALDPKLCCIEIGPEGTAIDAAAQARLATLISTATESTFAPAPPTTASRAYVWQAYIDDVALFVNGSTKYYVASNVQFSPQALTDAAGNVVERYAYRAHGQRVVVSADGLTARARSSFGFQRAYTGQPHDDETGLLYMRARYFDYERFISRDPAGYVDGSSLYAGHFVPNGVDPSGNLVVFVHGIGPTQHKDKAPLVYMGMIEKWNKLGKPIQGFTHFLYGPAGTLDPMVEDSARNIAAARALKAMIESIQKVRNQLTPCPADQEPIYIYAYSNGSIVTKLALEMGMKVDGVVFAGAALDSDTDLTEAIKGTPWLWNFHSDEDGTNGMVEGAGRNGFTNLPPSAYDLYVPNVDHYIEDDLDTASDAGRVNGYTEWDSRFMGSRYGSILNATNNSLSMGMQYTYPDGTVRPALGYNQWESDVK